MSIKFDALRVFVAVAEAGNIKDAAAKLARTPSAVSMTLKQLEDRLGAPLFASDRKARLSSVGEFVLGSAGPEIRRYERTVRSIEAYARNETGRLDLASVPSVALHLLPEILARFIARRPGIEIDLRDADSRAVQTAVERGDVELGIGGRPRASATLAYEPLFRDRFVAIAAANGPLAGSGGAVSRDELGHHAFLANGATAVIDCPFVRRLSDLSPLMVRNVASLLALVRAGTGITLLPELSVREAPHGLAILPLEPPAIYREVGILRDGATAPSPVAAAFVETLRSEMPGHVERIDAIERPRRRPQAARSAPARAEGDTTDVALS